MLKSERKFATYIEPINDTGIQAQTVKKRKNVIDDDPTARKGPSKTHVRPPQTELLGVETAVV